MVEGERYAAILMDCFMPSMDGYTAAGQIRNGASENARVPIIAITASVSGHIREKCLSAGMDSVITKPIREEDIRRELERFLVPGSLDSSASDPRPSKSSVIAPRRQADDFPIDRSTLFSLIGGDTEFLGNFVELFMLELPRLFSLLRQAIVDGDNESLRRLAHEVKGTSLSLAAHAAVEAAARLEAIGESGRLEGSEEVLARLRTELERVQKALQDVHDEQVRADLKRGACPQRVGGH
ncbi:MAG: response regulator [Chloroflexi bacterium]|nr:response regulator [Chloroflexota bacterium]